MGVKEVIGRPVVIRKRIGLGSLLRGMRVGGGEGCKGVDSDMGGEHDGSVSLYVNTGVTKC
jgi:hypothetical protein